MKKMLLIALLTVMASTLSAAKLTVKNSCGGAGISVAMKIKAFGWDLVVPLGVGETKTFSYPGKKILKFKWKVGKAPTYYRRAKYPVGVNETKSIEIKDLNTYVEIK